MQIEGTATKKYFGQLWGLIPEKIRPRRRKGWKAYDGVNNVLNLSYEVLSWKVHRACLKAKLEPFLGFLHSVQYNKPSLVCDLEELYRYLIDDFAFDYIQGLKPRDFSTKEVQVRDRKGRREYLSDNKTREMMRQSLMTIPERRCGVLFGSLFIICIPFTHQSVLLSNHQSVLVVFKISPAIIRAFLVRSLLTA